MKNETRQRLWAQVEEAKELGLTKLAEHISDSLIIPTIYAIPMTKEVLRNKTQLDLWKVALNTIEHHDLVKVDAQKIDETITRLADKMIDELEKVLGVDGKIGALEPKLPGQK